MTSPNGFRRVAAIICAALVVVLGVGCYSDARTPATAPGGIAGPTAVAGAADVQSVVDATNAFLTTLTAEQIKQAHLELSVENATAWETRPCGHVCRGGIGFGSLTDEQLRAAKAVLQAAMGTRPGVGYDQAMKVLMAEDVLNNVVTDRVRAGGPPLPERLSDGIPHAGHSPENYFLAVLGQPGADGTWQLHFGGHHLAANITYRDGRVAGATPFFIGAEPTSWTAGDGTTYAPLAVMRDGMVKLTGSLNADQLAKARLPESYTHVLMGPGQDGKFPQTRQGLKSSELSAAQKQLVMEAIRPWIAVVDDVAAATLMAEYQGGLGDTYIGYSGGAGLTNPGDYIRIDGPAVWVEVICEAGRETKQVHYHTVYRDRVRDYGGAFSF